MHKYVSAYERISEARAKTFRRILTVNLLLLKILLVFAKLALLSSGLK